MKESEKEAQDRREGQTFDDAAQKAGDGAASSMTSRQRLQAVLDHKPVDRLCVDFGAGGQTGIGVCAVDRLRKEITGDMDYRVKVIEPFQMLGEVDEELRKALRLDVVGVYPRCNMFGFENNNWKPFTIPVKDLEVMVPGDFNYTSNDEKYTYMYPQGDTSADPCAVMPPSGYFFDALNRQEPFEEEDLDPANNCEEFGELGDADIEHFVSKVKHFYDNTDYGIYLTIPGVAFGDIALVPATWASKPRGIRDITEWYLSTAMRPEYVHKIFETQCEIGLKNIEKLAEALGDMVQVAFVSGTDFGTQNGLFASPDTFRELYKPYIKTINDKIHELTNWKTFMHCCGGFREIIPDIIEAGIDVLNPIQYYAATMDAVEIKSQFGNDLVFWGAGVNTQKTLPFGTPDEVYREVMQQIEIFHADNTGFVFNSVHNIQSDVPTENMLAMFKAVDSVRF
jgi:hypothetical protein